MYLEGWPKHKGVNMGKKLNDAICEFLYWIVAWPGILAVALISYIVSLVARLRLNEDCEDGNDS